MNTNTPGALLLWAALIAATGWPGAARAAGPFDGTYTGTASMVLSNNRGVCKSYLASITVTDGRLTFVLGRNYATIHADVAADGSFSGAGVISAYRAPTSEQLKGKVSGTILEADASNPHCAYHLVLQRAS